jgi:serine/threonine protein phosphatase 1
MAVRVTKTDWVSTLRTPDRPFFAITDVHGCYDHLSRLHDSLESTQTAKCGEPFDVVHLGDYIDRGPDSVKVLKHLYKMGLDFARHPARMDHVLPGNHEQIMLDALSQVDKYKKDNAFDLWEGNGGDTTLLSAGLRVHPDSLSEFQLLLGVDMMQWLRSLKTGHANGKFVFVHAGVPTDCKKPCSVVDMPWSEMPKNAAEAEAHPLWVRKSFLNNAKLWADGAFVIHGHTPTSGMPDVKVNRMNLDTRCFSTGRLTMLEHKAGKYRFHIAATR